jgi:hypothetical protein
MTKRKKIILIIAAVIALLIAVSVRMSFHWTREETQSTVSTGSTRSAPSGGKLRVCRTIAILTPRVGSADVRLQNLIAGKLKGELEKRSIAREDSSSRSPVVTIYQTLAEAKRAKPDFYMSIEPRQYRYSFLPFAKNWNAKVDVYGSPSGVHSGTTVCTDSNTRYGFFTVDAEFDYHGRIVGIFTPYYLTSKIAEEVAKKTAEEMEEQTQDLVNDFLKTEKEQ